jgi:hypothetical protein
MPIKEAERVGSDSAYPNLDALGEGDGTLVVFRVVDLDGDEDDPEGTINKGKFGWNLPLIVDVLAVEQDEDGEVTGHKIYSRWLMKYGSNTMWVLRGHDKPKDTLKKSEVLALAKTGTNGPADEIIGRLIQKTSARSPKGYFVAFNKATPSDKAVALKVRDELGGDDWGTDDTEAPF